MKLLIVYASKDGHTAKIAHFLAGELERSSYAVQVENIADNALSPKSFDAVIIAASIHAGMYAAEMINYVTRYAVHLNSIPSLFLSVGLSITGNDPRALENLTNSTNAFFDITKWHPSKTEQVAGALLYTQYGFLKRLMMRSIMKRAGGATDTSRDYVYTDWDALRNSLHQFVQEFEMLEQ